MEVVPNQLSAPNTVKYSGGAEWVRGLHTNKGGEKKYTKKYKYLSIKPLSTIKEVGVIPQILINGMQVDN